MGRVWLAFSTFFRILANAPLAEKVRALEQAEPAQATPPPQKAEPRPAAPPVQKRSEALTLLEALQREARFLDFIQEEMTSYSDEQVGAAVREVHRGCHAVLDRLFGVAPVLSDAEGSQKTIADDEPGRIRLVGKVTQTRPVTGTVVHAGWQAQRCDVPVWNGAAAQQQILAPAEVEIS